MHEREKIKKLFDRYRQGRCTPEEQARLHAWLNQYAREEAGGLDELSGPYGARSVGQGKRWLRWPPYAAAIAAVALVTFWYVDGDGGVGDSVVETVSVPDDDVAPGGNRATLTLADGREIFLNESQSGIVMGDERILYQEGDEELANLDREAAAPLVLSTPKGGTYQITLSDGTAVWLNAASTLTYPSRFEGNTRTVTLSGEGYFEVTKDERKPFRVMSEGQQVEVLGTAFNVSAYPDDPETKTTLVTGAVRLGGVGNDVKLAPGQQGIMAGNEIRVETVDVDTYTGWKNNEFVFNGIELHEAMKQLGRWYDVEVVYEGKIPSKQFYGSFSRSLTLGETLNILKQARVNFSVQQTGATNRVIVKP